MATMGEPSFNPIPNIKQETTMNHKEVYDLQHQGRLKERAQYQLQKQAQLDDWKVELEEHKAMILEASGDEKFDLDALIQFLEVNIDQAGIKLAEVADANEETWDSIKDSVEHAWSSLKSDLSDLAAKLKQ